MKMGIRDFESGPEGIARNARCCGSSSTLAVPLPRAGFFDQSVVTQTRDWSSGGVTVSTVVAENGKMGARCEKGARERHN
jgi:hypothetical protein